MTYRGRVKNGIVIVESDAQLPEGAEVEIAVVRPSAPSGGNGDQTRSLLDRLGSVVGKAERLPPDAAAQVDHYLYGVPKK